MTDNNHPITPPPELILGWCRGWNCTSELTALKGVATQAARWGADQELNECCKWLPKLPPWSADDLRKHRRPKPPNLKELALEALNKIEDNKATYLDSSIVRRALEQLND